MSEQPCQGTYHFTVAADQSKGRSQRESLMAVRFVPVTIRRPQRLKNTDYPTSASLYAVDAQEVQPPPGQSPVHWRLLTTHPVMILEQSLQVIQWYS